MKKSGKSQTKDRESPANQASLRDFLIKGIFKREFEAKSQSRHQSKSKKEERPTRKSRERSGSHHFSHTDRISSLSASDSVEPEPFSPPVRRQPPPANINVQFYLNRTPSLPYGEYIDKMHSQWYHDYEKLERDHSFIQWIMPNSYQSRFNYHARPLSKTEAEEFRTNPQIAKRYLKSYDMMLGFYGIKMKSRQTGELTRSRNPNYRQRFHKTFITSWHNHMRITRILCSLAETGFGRYAVQLCAFLKREIYESGGELQLLRRYNVYKDWQPYEVWVESTEKTNVVLHKYLGKETLKEKKQEKEAKEVEKDSSQQKKQQKEEGQESK